MIVNIKDAEEKKLVIGYIKNIHRKKRCPFTNKDIYATWLNLWTDDFRIGEQGRCPIMFCEQLVLSKNKHRNGINPPEHYKEYTAIIDTVRELFNTYYNPKKSTRFNAKPYIKLLIEYRNKRTEGIEQLLRDTGLYKNGYRIKVKGKAVYTELVKIHLYRSKNNKVKSIIMGSFDTVEDYVNKMLEDNNDLQKL